MSASKLGLLVVATCLAIGCQKTAAPVSIEDAWIRLSPPGAAVTAGYFTINNRASDTLQINRVSSDAFGNIEIHQSSMANGKMTMRAVDTLTVQSNGSVSLKPGGLHLMLFEPTQTLAEGDAIQLILFDGERPVAEISATIARDNPHD